MAALLKGAGSAGVISDDHEQSTDTRVESALVEMFLSGPSVPRQ